MSQRANAALYGAPFVLPDISPTRGEIGSRQRFRQFPTLQERRRQIELLISPQVGEMAGRPEGGAVECGRDELQNHAHPFIAMMRFAAFNPGAPETPPPGCEPAPARNSPSTGVS